MIKCMRYKKINCHFTHETMARAWKACDKTHNELNNYVDRHGLAPLCTMCDLVVLREISVLLLGSNFVSVFQI